ncbi:unnamed protein product [Durusdinium trenchii]|uniref:Methyltransferase type 11 domain-containing protein n=1 Tax=Durusdinium trenchii TaxID=1381693 RepID=A0ABP0RYA4_9DINO
MSNLFDVLEDGGYAFLSAPLTGVSDKLPFHFYHSTWTGLATLMNRSGFEVLEMRRWGNLDYEVEISKLNSEPKSDDLTNLQHQRFHEDFAWGLFRKSAAKYNQTCFGTSTRWLQHWAYTASETMNLWNVIEPSMRGTYSNEIKAIPQLLSFGGAEYELHLGPHQRRVVDFGPYRGTSGDLHKLSLEDLTSKLAPGTAGVDFCILGQTLEHLYDPYLAVQNLFDVTAPCGFLFTSTPFANIPHMMPHHHYHYSSMGLAMLFHRAGFEVVEIGQWGSQEYLSKLFQTTLAADERLKNLFCECCQFAFYDCHACASPVGTMDCRAAIRHVIQEMVEVFSKADETYQEIQEKKEDMNILTGLHNCPDSDPCCRADLTAEKPAVSTKDISALRTTIEECEARARQRVEDVMSDLRRESLNGKSSDRFAIQKELQERRKEQLAVILEEKNVLQFIQDGAERSKVLTQFAGLSAEKLELMTEDEKDVYYSKARSERIQQRYQVGIKVAEELLDSKASWHRNIEEKRDSLNDLAQRARQKARRLGTKRTQ